MSAIAAFDAIATDYDHRFTETTIGRRMRHAVWRRLDARLRAGDRVLEINCGTGEDAVHLGARGVDVLATDGSAAMVALARGKVAAAGLADRVRVARLAVESLDASVGVFDGALSNFGGLNCVADLESFGHRLATCVRPGGVALLCVMGPLAPWEWAWFLAHGRPGQAARRLARGGTIWRGAGIRYPSIRRLRGALAPWFRLDRVAGIGCLLPPPCTERHAAAHPKLVDRLDRIERRIETAWPVARLADHYLAELARTPASASREA